MPNPLAAQDAPVDPHPKSRKKPSPEAGRASALAAVTFDLWNTLYAADGQYAAVVRPERLRLLAGILLHHGVRATKERLEQAYQTGYEAYLAAWISGRHFGAREQVHHFLSYFGVAEASIDREALAATARAIEEASRLAPPAVLSGVPETLESLAALGYRLGLISDTSLTPGRVLREFLAQDGLLRYFSTLTFSDETGYPKPDPRMFQTTLARLSLQPGPPLPPSAAAHVGDTPRTDIAGARAVGFVAIRYAAVNDHPEPPPADYVIKDHRELPQLLARIRG